MVLSNTGEQPSKDDHNGKFWLQLPTVKREKAGKGEAANQQCPFPCVFGASQTLLESNGHETPVILHFHVAQAPSTMG